MKSTYFIAISILILPLTACLYGCDLEPNGELNKVTYPLSYKRLLGTYLFQPNNYEAPRLGIEVGDSVILNITYDSLNVIKHIKYYYGTYHINKRVLILHKNSKISYEGNWSFYNFKDSGNRGVYINSISFDRKIMDGRNIGFNIEKRLSDTLHIVGYIWDPKDEAVKVIDFKKIK